MILIDILTAVVWSNYVKVAPIEVSDVSITCNGKFNINYVLKKVHEWGFIV